MIIIAQIEKKRKKREKNPEWGDYYPFYSSSFHLLWQCRYSDQIKSQKLAGPIFCRSIRCLVSKKHKKAVRRKSICSSIFNLKAFRHDIVSFSFFFFSSAKKMRHKNKQILKLRSKSAIPDSHGWEGRRGTFSAIMWLVYITSVPTFQFSCLELISGQAFAKRQCFCFCFIYFLFGKISHKAEVAFLVDSHSV